MTEILVSCESIGKKFCRDLKKSLWYGLKDATFDVLGLRRLSTTHTLRSDEFWALKDVNLEVRRGECVALIGRNGAGKTTLLKLLMGLIRPDQGKITISGSIGGLIALGAGFNPILTGRENILIAGSVLGLSQKQIADRLESIVNFAEISHAINSPVRTYSSGMQVRLGFSVAINLIKPDVLVLDEVLAVGDIGFTVKCLNAMRDLTSQSAAIFVSHSMQQVTLFCTHAMFLRNGSSVYYSDNVARVIDRYYEDFQLEACYSGNSTAKIHDMTLHSSFAGIAPSPHLSVRHGDHITLELDVETQEAAYIRVGIRTQNLFPLIDSAIKQSNSENLHIIPRGRRRIVIDLGEVDYNAGLYPIVFGIFSQKTKQVLVRVESGTSLRVYKEEIDYGAISRRLTVQKEVEMQS